ncbi:MAG: hypothetical protein KC766_14160 [Myxococcales bacterium]|nr:hypothetical protein [Myxococcales bacterium]
MGQLRDVTRCGEDASGGSTTLTRNLDDDAWYDFQGRKQMVGALLDRLRHRCTTIRIEGTSLRQPE